MSKRTSIEKKSYAVMQDALLEKDASGSWKPKEMAKEGMTTLKKHSTSLTVVCTASSVEDVKGVLEKNDIPHDNVIKMDTDFDFLVTGDENCVKAWSWTSALSDIGWKLKHGEGERKDTQEVADNSLEQFFKKAKQQCICNG